MVQLLRVAKTHLFLRKFTTLHKLITLTDVDLIPQTFFRQLPRLEKTKKMAGFPV